MESLTSVYAHTHRLVHMSHAHTAGLLVYGAGMWRVVVCDIIEVCGVLCVLVCNVFGLYVSHTWPCVM